MSPIVCCINDTRLISTATLTTLSTWRCTTSASKVVLLSTTTGKLRLFCGCHGNQLATVVHWPAINHCAVPPFADNRRCCDTRTPVAARRRRGVLGSARKAVTHTYIINVYYLTRSFIRFVVVWCAQLQRGGGGHRRPAAVLAQHTTFGRRR